MAKPKTITVNQLHRMMGKLIEQGEGRVQVCINKDTFKHNCESDGCVILNVDGCRVESVLQIQDDGGTCDDKGMEHYRRTVVLFGDSDNGPKL